MTFEEISKELYAVYCPFCGEDMDTRAMYSGDFCECPDHGIFVLEWKPKENAELNKKLPPEEARQ